jgi:hypothetical protein
MGFNPTDDGFVLAYGRRILDGQVPHLDFISIRPVGSPLLHLPELLLGGDHVIYASRLFWWYEWAFVAWVWVGLLATLLDVELDAGERFALQLLVFMLSAHVAPPRAWHTVDGIFLASLGVHLASGSRPSRKAVGYLLVGTACLCKQNFAAFAPAALVGLGDWRQPRYWLAVAVPGALYVLAVTALGGGPDLLVQLGAQHDLVSAGITAYVSRPPLVLGVLGGLIAGWLSALPRLDARGTPGPSRWAVLAAVLGGFTVLLAPLGLLASAITGSYTLYARVPAFALFGFVLGRLSGLLGGRNIAATRAAFLALALAWASSISRGYTTPAYATGILAAFLLLRDYPFLTPSRQSGHRRRWLPLAVLTVFTACGFVSARTQVIYREQVAARLDRPLGDVFPGGRGIRTNRQTYAFLADLDRAVRIAHELPRRYAILPDLPGYWVASRQANPLPIDWPQSIELPHPALFRRVTRSIEENRGRVLFLVQKVRADTLAGDIVPLAGDGIYAIVGTVRASLVKVGETEFFEIYE